jgi:adenosylmethionine-8-amino-7-oxononanoate aminotransferase
MMCLSKALTGGTIPMAITTLHKSYLMLYDDDINKALRAYFYGKSYGLRGSKLV